MDPAIQLDSNEPRTTIPAMSILRKAASKFVAVGFLVTNFIGFGETYNLDPGFKLPAFNDDAFVSGCVFQKDGSILIAGSFDTVNFRLSDPLVRILPDGTPDELYRPQFNRGSDFVDGIFALQNGQVIVSGTFGSSDRAI